MQQLRDYVDLAPKSIVAHRRTEVLIEHFDGDVATVLGLNRQKHG